MPPVSLAFQLGHLLFESDVFHRHPDELAQGGGRGVLRQLDRHLGQPLGCLLPGAEQDQSRVLDRGRIGELFGLEPGRGQAGGQVVIQDIEVKPRHCLHQSVPPPPFLASSRGRRPGAFGAEACVKGPGASSSRI